MNRFVLIPRITLTLVLLTLAACSPAAIPATSTPLPTLNLPVPSNTATTAPTPTVTVTPQPTITPTDLPTPTPTDTMTPSPTPVLGCFPGGSTSADSNPKLDNYLDITKFTSSINKDVLTAIFQMPDLPQTISTNASGMKTNDLELSWGVLIDVDNDVSTGGTSSMVSGSGFDYQITASHWVVGNLTLQPIPNSVQVDLWKIAADGSATKVPGAAASITVDATNHQMSLTGQVPGIGPNSRLVVYSYRLYPDASVGKKVLCLGN